MLFYFATYGSQTTDFGGGAAVAVGVLVAVGLSVGVVLAVGVTV